MSHSALPVGGVTWLSVPKRKFQFQNIFKNTKKYIEIWMITWRSGLAKIKRTICTNPERDRKIVTELGKNDLKISAELWKFQNKSNICENFRTEIKEKNKKSSLKIPTICLRVYNTSMSLSGIIHKNRNTGSQTKIPVVAFSRKKFRSAEFHSRILGGMGVVRLLWPRRVPRYVTFRILVEKFRATKNKIWPETYFSWNSLRFWIIPV